MDCRGRSLLANTFNKREFPFSSGPSLGSTPFGKLGTVTLVVVWISKSLRDRCLVFSGQMNWEEDPVGLKKKIRGNLYFVYFFNFSKYFV